jgi:hypothetical protein
MRGGRPAFMEQSPHEQLALTNFLPARLRQAAAVALAAIGCNAAPAVAGQPNKHPLVASKSGMVEANVPAQPQTQITQPDGPHMELCAADDKVVYHDSIEGAQRVARDAKAMGATCWRMMVNLSYLEANNWDFDRFDQTKRVLDQDGLKVNVTINFNGVGQSDEEIMADTEAVVRHFDQRGVDEFELWNEPNIGWIEPCDYLHRYRVAEQTVHDIDPALKVGNGTVSGYNYGLDYLKKEADCIKSDGEPLYADAIALNPYSFIASPYETSPPDNAQGIGMLEQYVKWLDDMFADGKIMTHSGEEPRIVVQEFAYWQDTRGRRNDPNVSPAHQARYLDPETASAYYQMALAKLCAYQNVGRATIFGVQAQDMDAKTDWESGEENQQDSPLLSFFSIQSFKQDHGECFLNNGIWQQPTPKRAAQRPHYAKPVLLSMEDQPVTPRAGSRR